MMICTLVWTAIIASLYLPENDGKSLPYSADVEELMHMSPIPMDSAKCGYRDLSMKYLASCQYSTWFLGDIFYNVSAGVLTGQALLQRISTVCSKYDSYRKCANCFAKRDCPEERPMLFEAIIGKWSVFCEKNQVSDWLKITLQNGYSYNSSCEETYIRKTDTCYDKANSEFPYNATAYQLGSLSEGISLARTYASAVLKCTIGEVLGVAGLLWRECGLTWQDALLTEWLKSSVTPEIGYYINQDEIKILQDIRC